MALLEKTRQLIRQQNKLGRLLRLRATKIYLLNLLRFHPFRRFFNFWHYLFLTLIKKYKPLQLDKKIKNGVFYICMFRDKGSTSVLKIPRIDNVYSYSLWEKLCSLQAFNEYSSLLLSLSTDPIWNGHVPIAEQVRRDGGYVSSYVVGFNMTLVKEILLNRNNLPNDLCSSDLILAIDDLLANLREYVIRNGRLIGDWGLHNLIYEKTSRKIINVDLEGFYMTQDNKLQADMFTAKMEYIETELCTMKTILEIREGQDSKDMGIIQVLATLRYVTQSDVAYNAQGFYSGYHSLKLKDTYFRGQRECSERLAIVPYDFTDKIVLDIGCNCGGMLHCLASKITRGIGIDLDSKCVNAANLITRLNGVHNLGFYTFDLDNENLALINNFILGAQVDICFLLSLAMWLKNWKQVISYASELATTLLFESNGDRQQQKEQIEYLHACFSTVEIISAESFDDPNQKDRVLYLCRNE